MPTGQKPYRKAVNSSFIAGLLMEADGKDFNPLLVDNFIQSLKRVSTAEF